MPAGNSTARPYNRSTKEIATAKRKLAARTANASRNAQSRRAGEKYNDDRANTPSNAKVGRGIFGANDVGPSDDALQAIRNIGAREDKKAAKKLKPKADQKELERTSAAKEKARIKNEDEVIKAMGKDFKGAKGGKISKNGITRMRKGGKPAVKPKKPTHRNMLEGERPMRPLITERFDLMQEERQNKKSKTSAPKPKRNGGKIAKMAHGGGIELRGKTRGRII